YLAQIVFYTDIQRFIDSEATQALDTARTQLTRPFDIKIDNDNKEINDKRSALEQEVAGKGLSGKYGLGPAAKTLGDDVQKLEKERDELAAGKESARQAFDELARDWRSNRDKLAGTYNVNLPQTSILQNRRALDELRKRPENQS